MKCCSDTDVTPYGTENGVMSSTIGRGARVSFRNRGIDVPATDLGRNDHTLTVDPWKRVGQRTCAEQNIDRRTADSRTEYEQQRR